ncbi:MAG: metallophosphoesterase [Bacteroidota bacterium]
MNIQICSDLHLEFASNRAWLTEHPLIPKGDILLIAGDTYHLDRDYGALDFIQKAANSFERVYLIPGNHEYYGGFDVATALQPTYRTLLENVFIVNNHVEEIGDVKFIFSTMWSKVERNIAEVFRGMTDFRRIKFNGAPFTINHYNEIHDFATAFLEEAAKLEGKKVVVTHHLPSSFCNIERFRNSPLNEAFCAEKTDFIAGTDINYWIYGHSHGNKEDFEIKGTRLVTNQLGYVDYGEHLAFQRDRIIEI